MKTVEAAKAHAASILPRMRLHDVSRFHAITNGNTVPTLEGLIARSIISWCGVTNDNEPVSLGGVVEMGNQTGYVWQVASADLCDHKRSYIEQGRQMMVVGMKRFARLETRIAADYPQALRHMQRLGWDVGPSDAALSIPSHLCVRNR